MFTCQSFVFIFKPTYSISGWRWPGPIPADQGTRTEPALARTPFHHRVHSYTHTHWEWDYIDKPIHLMGTSLGCGRKLEYPKTRGECANCTQTVALARNQFFLINIITTMLKETFRDSVNKQRACLQAAYHLIVVT